jgi:DNA polymerase III subunit epsilon
MGADINTSISKLTNIVVIGKGAGPAKMKKIQELIEKGYPLRLIYESEFLSLMSNEGCDVVRFQQDNR